MKIESKNINRREFVALSSAAGAAGLLSSIPGTAQAADFPSRKMQLIFQREPAVERIETSAPFQAYGQSIWELNLSQVSSRAPQVVWDMKPTWPKQLTTATI